MPTVVESSVSERADKFVFYFVLSEVTPHFLRLKSGEFDLESIHSLDLKEMGESFAVLFLL